MGVLSWLFTGLIVGAIARLLVRGPHNLGCIGTSFLGIIGSFIGGTLIGAITGDGFTLQAAGFFGAVAGAVILLVLARLFGGSGRPPPRSFEDNLDQRR
ncbi:MAG: GlsB/YeaQ/YmgE family stress response membrane protein [Acidimicrobiales bacterium]